MRFFASILLIFSVLTASVGSAASMHFCQDQLVKTEFGLEKAGKCCCGTEKTNDNCCSDKEVYLKADNPYHQFQAYISVTAAHVLLYVQEYSPIISDLTTSKKINFPLAEASPPRPDIYIQVSSFLL